MAAESTTAAEILNHNLRGELSAIETYELALPKFEQYPQAAQELRRIRDEHKDTVRVLKEQVQKLGGTPSEGSGPWGTFTQLLTGAAKVIGPDTTLGTLKTGEEHGINDYKASLEKEGLPADAKDLIRGTLLPRCQKHLTDLDSIRAFVK